MCKEPFHAQPNLIHVLQKQLVTSPLLQEDTWEHTSVSAHSIL